MRHYTLSSTLSSLSRCTDSKPCEQFLRRIEAPTDTRNFGAHDKRTVIDSPTENYGMITKSPAGIVSPQSTLVDPRTTNLIGPTH